MDWLIATHSIVGQQPCGGCRRGVGDAV